MRRGRKKVAFVKRGGDKGQGGRDEKEEKTRKGEAVRFRFRVA